MSTANPQPCGTPPSTSFDQNFTRRTVTTIIAAVVGLALLFGFGNVWGPGTALGRHTLGDPTGRSGRRLVRHRPPPGHLARRPPVRQPSPAPPGTTAPGVLQPDHTRPERDRAPDRRTHRKSRLRRRRTPTASRAQAQPLSSDQLAQKDAPLQHTSPRRGGQPPATCPARRHQPLGRIPTPHLSRKTPQTPQRWICTITNACHHPPRRPQPCSIHWRRHTGRIAILTNSTPGPWPHGRMHRWGRPEGRSWLRYSWPHRRKKGVCRPYQRRDRRLSSSVGGRRGVHCAPAAGARTPGPGPCPATSPSHRQIYAATQTVRLQLLGAPLSSTSTLTCSDLKAGAVRPRLRRASPEVARPCPRGVVRRPGRT
jgi:hypothetical protein